MDKIVGLIGKKPKSSKRDDDISDRISSRYTVAMLVAFAAIVGMTQYVGKPITCWAPKHFTGSHTKYTNSYCWVRNTYYLPLHQDLPVPRPGEDRDYIQYYQWIPFILLAQAVLFYIPSAVWHGLNQKAGVDSDNILAAAHSFSQAAKVDRREKMKKLIANQMHRFLCGRRGYIADMHFDFKKVSKGFGSFVNEGLGAYLVVLFLISKLLYIVNVIGQLFLLNAILSADYHIYGFEVLKGLMADHNWDKAQTVVFPRVTMCDFKVRRLGNIHRYTVQCVLPINLYNEKIYVFLWFWMVFVAFMSVLGFVTWLLRAIMYSDKVTYVKNHLKVEGRLNDQRDKDLVPDFVSKYLRQDGIFLLRLIGHNTNNITVTEIMCALWDKFKEQRKLNEDEDEDGNSASTEIEDGRDDDVDKKLMPPDEEKKPL